MLEISRLMAEPELDPLLELKRALEATGAAAG
jgi:hypothetical protein